MLYVKTDNNTVVTYPYTVAMLRDENPETSFPTDVPPELLAEYGVYAVRPEPEPVVDYTQDVNEGLPELINDIWTQVWVVTPASQDEVDTRIAAQWVVVRSQRNAMLAETDWTQLPNAPFTPEEQQAWADYRQELRDITTQPDPFNIVWPVAPKGAV